MIANFLRSQPLGNVDGKLSQMQLVRQSQIVQSVMYSYDAVISSYITPAIHSWDFDDET